MSMDKTNKKDKNNNKSFSISRYAFQNFKHYGGKSMIFMIVLAVTLVMSLLNISTSLQRSIELAAIYNGGDAHIQFLHVTPEQIEEIKKQPEVEWAGEYVMFMNFSANTANKSGSLVYLENLGTMDGFKIIKGIVPEKENEIALSPYVAEYLGIEAKVGVEFETEIENVPVKFVISGIVQEHQNFKNMGIYHFYVSKDFAESKIDGSQNSRDMFVKLKKGYEVYNTATKLAEITGIEKDNINYNYAYLYASLNSFGNQIVFYIIIAFFMVVGSIIIYNAFNIIIAKRTRHFGLLTLIGASKKQIRKCVYIEACLNTVIALPLGLLLGTFGSWAVTPLVAAMDTSEAVGYHINAWSYIFTVLITAVMIFAGAIIPARRAGKISPVEAAKFLPGNIQSGKKMKKIKVKKNITLPVLSRMNLFRKRGAGGIVTSLSIVGMLVICLMFVFYSTYESLGGLVKQQIASDIRIMRGMKDGGVAVDTKPMFPENIIEEIKNIDGVEKSHVFYSTIYKIPDIETVTIINGVMYDNYGLIFGVDDEIMSEYLEYSKMRENDKINLSSFENHKNVLSLEYITEKYGVTDGFNPGMDVNLDVYPSIPDENLSKQTATLHISAVASRWDVPPYINGLGNLPTLVMPMSSVKANNLNMQCHAICLYIDESKYDSVTAALDKICGSEGNIHYESFAAAKKEIESQFTSIMILIFAGLSVVFLVSVLNLISTTFIGIDQRKKELGVLSALGLGQKELKKMLKLEGIWVSVFSTVISSAGGFGLGYLFYLWIESMGGDYIKLTFPFVPIIIFCLIYIFAPYIISSIAVRKLLKSTTVELIGQEI